MPRKPEDWFREIRVIRALKKKKTQTKLFKIMTKDTWSKILNIVITVLTAIATTFGVTSCMGV